MEGGHQNFQKVSNVRWMKPAIDAPDEDNNDDDNGNDGHDEREGDNSCLDNNMRVRPTLWA